MDLPISDAAESALGECAPGDGCAPGVGADADAAKGLSACKAPCGENEGEREGGAPKRIAVFCVGNKLYLDDGVGPAVYEEVLARYDVPANVTFHDVGCMSMDMIESVRENDLIITVDAVDGTGAAPGTVFRFAPQDMARNVQARTSLHDMRLADLFDAAALLGYSSDGVCLGLQVQNRNPVEFMVGLTPAVYDALPLLIDTLLAELAKNGSPLVDKVSGRPVVDGSQPFSYGALR